MAVRRGYTVDYDLTDKKNKRKMPVSNRHQALGTTTVEPFPPNTEMIMFGMGCYWGAGGRLLEGEPIVDDLIQCIHVSREKVLRKKKY